MKKKVGRPKKILDREIKVEVEYPEKRGNGHSTTVVVQGRRLCGESCTGSFGETGFNL